MKLRSLVVTIAVLAVLSAVVYLARRSTAPASTDPRVGRSLLDAAVAEKAAQLRLTDQGKTVTLARQPDATWRVTSYYDLPADFSKLTGLVGDLTGAKLQRLVTRSPARMARLGFKDTKIELLDSGGGELWSVLLGKNAETGGGRFVRFGTEPKAYLADLNSWLDTESKNWADSQLLNLKPGDIAKIEVPAAPPLTFTRAKKDAPWTADQTPAHEKVNAGKIVSLLDSLTSLRFTDTTAPADPKAAEAKAHDRTFRLTTFDGKTYTVALGRQPGEKKLKPPAATTDGKTGPAALGPVAAAGKKEPPVPESAGQPTPPAKPLAPEYETIPAGPVFVTIAAGDAAAPINAAMKKRAFQISDYVFTGLPQTTAELFEPVPKPAAPPRPAAIPAPKP